MTGVNSDNRSSVFVVSVDTRRSTLPDSCPVFFRLRPLSVDHPTVSQTLRIVLYSFIVQVDRTQLILHTSSFPYMVYL